MSANKRNWLLSSIWLIAIVPLAIAWIMAFTGYGIPDSTKNKGELMPSGLVVPESLIKAQQGHWGLVVVSEQCLLECQQQLHRAQQLYLAMGKEAKRLQTVWLSDTVNRYENFELDVAIKPSDSIEESSRILNEVQFQKMVQLADEKTLTWFNQHKIEWQDYSIFFIDPLGNLVLRFKPELEGAEMMSDIKWLLKASRLG